jgi:hypothetical protein
MALDPATPYPLAVYPTAHLEILQVQAIRDLAAGCLPEAVTGWSAVLRHLVPLLDLARDPQPGQGHNRLSATASGRRASRPSLSVIHPPPQATAPSSDTIFSLFPYGFFYAVDDNALPGSSDSDVSSSLRRAGAAASYNMGLAYSASAIAVSGSSSSRAAALLNTALNAYRAARDLLESARRLPEDGDDRSAEENYSGWTEGDHLLLLAITNNEGNARERLVEAPLRVMESLQRLQGVLRAHSVAMGDLSPALRPWRSQLYRPFRVTSCLYPPDDGPPLIHAAAA